MARFSETSETEDVIQLIGFYAGDKFFGTNILSVLEILRGPNIEPVQQAPGFIDGTVNLRGRRIPVVDLSARLDPGHEPRNGGPAWLLVTAVDHTMVGYRVDAVTRIMKISPGSILPAPDLMLAGLRSQYILGVCKTEMGLLIVANLVHLLEADEVEALKTLKPL